MNIILVHSLMHLPTCKLTSIVFIDLLRHSKIYSLPIYLRKDTLSFPYISFWLFGSLYSVKFNFLSPRLAHFFNCFQWERQIFKTPAAWLGVFIALSAQSFSSRHWELKNVQLWTNCSAHRCHFLVSSPISVEGAGQIPLRSIVTHSACTTNK